MSRKTPYARMRRPGFRRVAALLKLTTIGITAPALQAPLAAVELTPVTAAG